MPGLRLFDGTLITVERDFALKISNNDAETIIPLPHVLDYLRLLINKKVFVSNLETASCWVRLYKLQSPEKIEEYELQNTILETLKSINSLSLYQGNSMNPHSIMKGQ